MRTTSDIRNGGILREKELKTGKPYMIAEFTHLAKSKRTVECGGTGQTGRGGAEFQIGECAWSVPGKRRWVRVGKAVVDA